MAERIVRVSLMAQVTNYLQNTEAARQKTLQLAAASEDASAKFERQNAAMRDAGVRLTAFGAVALVATGLAVKAAIDWQSAWTGVTKTVDGSAEEMAALEDQLRSLTGVLPATHEEIAGVAEAAGQLGVAREDVAAFTKTMIDLSETTNLTADEAATSIAQLMNVMQTAPEDVDNLGAALVALGNDGASTERDIVQMAQRIAGAGKIVGLTEAQVLGFANALASVGIEAEAGGTAISRIMTDIAMSVSAGGEELDKFAAVAGMSAKEFSAAFKKDPADAIATFVEGLARINAEGGDVFATLSDLGQSDIRVSQALLGMANSGDLLRKSLQLGTQAWKDNTALIEEATKRYGTAEAKIQIASNSIRDAAIDWGSVFLPAVSAVAEVIADAAQGFSRLPEPIQATAAVTVALAGAASLAAGAFLLGVPAVAQFNAQLAILRASEIPGVATAANVATNAIGKTTAGLGAAARFLTGPWGLALAAAAVGTAVLGQALDRLKASSEQMQNSLQTSANGLEILKTASSGPFFLNDVAGQFEDLTDTLRKLDEFKNKPWWQPSAAGAGLAGAEESLARIGTELGKLYGSDVPAAQAAFEKLAAQTDGSDESLRRLVDALGPDFEAALVQRAIDLKIATEGMSDAERNQVLLNLALEGAEDPAKTAAESYQEAAQTAKSLTDEIFALIDAVNESNGLGQDAVTTNARWLDSLGGIADEVQRQRDAFEQANGTLDGFTLSLDESTRTGSQNAAMLAEVAGSAKTAADAQYQLDLQTMSSKDATDKYADTLAAQRQAFIDSATQAGFNADEVQKLADKVFALPDSKTMQIIAETAAAAGGLEDLARRINNLPNQKRINIVLEMPNGTKVSDQQLANQLGIGGYAAGGRIPGPISYRDNRIAMVATGEYIVNTAATMRHLPLLEAINSGQQITGYENGGLVRPEYASSYSGAYYASRGPAIGELHVHAAPGMDEDALVRKAVRAVEAKLK